MATILVVDDRSINRQFLVTLLGYFNHRMLEAADGQEAFEIAQAQRPDLVIADILMPRMNGIELSERLRADPELSAIAIIFYSATYRLEETRRLAAQSGVRYVIGKPAEPETILQIVEQAIGTAPSMPVWQPRSEVGFRPATDGFTEKFLSTVQSLEKVSLRLSAIVETSLDLTAERDPARLLTLFCRAARNILSSLYVAVAITDGRGGKPTRFASSGYDRDAEDALRKAAERGEFPSVLPEGRRTMRSSDAAEDPERLGLPSIHPPVRSLVAASLHLGDRELGWVCATNKLGHVEYDEEDERIVHTLAALAAAAYENAHLYAEVKEHAGKLRLEIGHRRAAEEALRLREAQLSSVAANHPGIVFQRRLSGDGRSSYPFISDRAFELCGYSAHELMDDPALLRTLVVPEDLPAFQRAVERSAREVKSMESDFRVKTREGSVKWMRSLSTPRYLANGDIVWDGIILDVTRQKELEQRQKEMQQELHRSQRLEAVGTLSGGMAHDFNNLLQVIIMNLSLVKDRVSGDPLAVELTEAAAGAGRRGADLIRRLLAFSRRQALDPVPFDMGELVKSMMRLLSETLGEQIEISIDIAPDLWIGFTDPAQVESALANLAVNARDAMPQGGKLFVHVRNTTLDLAYAASHRDAAPGDYLLLEVSDTGVGMSAETLAHAFEPFFTTKDVGKGTGLGLSMVYGFAKQSGGHVNLYSEEGKGTTVRLYIPRAKTERERSEARENRTSLALPVGNEVILVVDDKDDVRQTAKRALEYLGYRTVEAANAEDALALLESGTKVDLLFTDIIMPGGILGTELARQALVRHPGLKVLFTSGFPDALRRQEAVLPANSCFLTKPYPRSELAIKVRQVLDG